MNQFRGALRDPAEHSQYIKTVPRRGYRFVAAVTRVAPDEHRPRVATAADDESRPQVNRTAPTLPSDAIEKGDPFSLTRFPGARRFGFAALLLFVLLVLPSGEPRADGTAASQHLQRTRLSHHYKPIELPMHVQDYLFLIAREPCLTHAPRA